MTLAHDVAGNGPALILLHSAVCDRRMWDPQWQALVDAGYRVVRCDFHGHGDSPIPDQPFNDTDDVIELLKTLGIERTALVASSFGGQVALELAARRPDMVTAMVLLCARSPELVPSDTLRAFGRREEELLEAGDLDGAADLNVETFVGPEADDAVRQKVRLMQRRAFEIQLAVDDVPYVESPEVDLSLIKAPVLAVSGAHDVPDFGQIAAGLPEKLPNARHQELPWAGHLPSLERPDEVTDLLTRFLRDNVPAT
jgi:pimeloyl-ACP methyl ester carboxylesterase